MLALTFDDGPDPRGTPAVLEALDAAGVSATFFVLGERVERHPELFERVRAAGHEVEVHGYAHLRHPHVTRAPRSSATSTARSTCSAARRRWRIPWGHLADFTQEVADQRGLEIVGWSTDTHDWRGDSAEVMLEGLELDARWDRARARRDQRRGAHGTRRTRPRGSCRCSSRRRRRRGLTPGPLTTDVAGADPHRESRVPSRGSAARVTALATQDVLNEIAANAAELDRNPAFPHAAFAALKEAGALTPPPDRADEWARVRAVSKADGSVGPDLRRAPERLRAADARGHRSRRPPARRLGRRSDAG